MTPKFDNELNRRIYAEWHVDLLDRLFGDLIDLRWDLYELTHSHRRRHNEGIDQGPCTAWPSPPYRAPVWRLIVEIIGATRFLEVGTGIGYTAALMADAGGITSQVDTIEIDDAHADLAETELARMGLLDRVCVLRGDAKKILPTLAGPYDVVFVGGGEGDMSRHLKRLARPGGAPAEIKERLREPLMGTLITLRDALRRKDKDASAAVAEARRQYRIVVRQVLETATTQ